MRDEIVELLGGERPRQVQRIQPHGIHVTWRSSLRCLSLAGRSIPRKQAAQDYGLLGSPDRASCWYPPMTRVENAARTLAFCGRSSSLPNKVDRVGMGSREIPYPWRDRSARNIHRAEGKERLRRGGTADFPCPHVIDVSIRSKDRRNRKKAVGGVAAARPVRGSIGRSSAGPWSAHRAATSQIPPGTWINRWTRLGCLETAGAERHLCRGETMRNAVGRSPPNGDGSSPRGPSPLLSCSRRRREGMGPSPGNCSPSPPPLRVLRSVFDQVGFA